MFSLCCGNCTKHVSILCCHNVGFLNVKLGGTYSNHRVLNDNSGIYIVNDFITCSLGAFKVICVYVTFVLVCCRESENL